jgi:hypothetical protein
LFAIPDLVRNQRNFNDPFMLLTALMIGQQGVEVESMLANQHAVGSVTVTAAPIRPIRRRWRRTTARSSSACRLLVVQTDRRGRCAEMGRQASKISK